MTPCVPTFTQEVPWWAWTILGIAICSIAILLHGIVYDFYVHWRVERQWKDMMNSFPSPRIGVMEFPDGHEEDWEWSVTEERGDKPGIVFHNHGVRIIHGPIEPFDQDKD